MGTKNNWRLTGLLCLFLSLAAAPALAAGEGLLIDEEDYWLSRARSPRTPASRPTGIHGKAPAFKPGAIIVRPRGASAGDAPESAASLDDYEDAPQSSVADPLEPWNRFWFRFNDIFYLYVARPAYTAWEYVTPRQVRSGLKNFFHNVLFPIRMVNNLLQLRFFEAGAEFGRFFINTTTTLGFADIAKDKKTRVPVDPAGEDFGQTLGRWGIGHGIYLVWPFLGPSSLRETVGWVGDLFGDPSFYLTPWELAGGVGVGRRFNDLDGVLPLYEDLKKAAVDPYISMREAYINYRNQHVKQ